jgi:type I restriction-modification system DNA methylase subunit
MPKEDSNQALERYFFSLSEKFHTGQAREHAYRPVLESLIHSLDASLKIINDPSRSEHGNPDFVFLRGDITTGYTETKDIGVDLDKIEKSKQMERYLGYSNLILTDYLEFRFFKNGTRYGELIRIGSIADGKMIANSGAFGALADALSDFLEGEPEPIKSGKRLAAIMGGKARRIRDNVRHFLAENADIDTDILRIYESIKKMLVHDLTPAAFADMYAQTLVYGLFVARYHDKSKDTFTRAEARDLVPESNPFLRQFFNHIAGSDFNKRLKYIVDELCAVFACADVNALMEEYFKKNGAGEGQDPVIHFYEDFLKEYDAALRKKMGAYYTPLSVVRFIVRAVDYVLKTEFNLAEGLADTSKLPSGQHKVQVLDPAVGTGTFISAVIRIIYERLIEHGQKGRWPAYVHHDLLPRIHGFEIMMAAYTIAHLKLSIAFKQTGFTIFNKRLGIYLTNSLEQANQQGDLLSFGLAQSIAEEAQQAAVIKNETPIMVVLGNPPYSVSSSNKSEWIQELIKVYKEGLGERKINLDDDYIKFIRLAEHFIEKNGSGIVAMITNNSFIDGITHRQMRKHLLGTFDDIYILDLHGNSKKREKAPDGGKDGNVFDIQQGVAISIFVRKEGKKKSLGAVHYAELYGTRGDKFVALDAGDMKSIKWKMLEYTEPLYFFVPKDFRAIKEYNEGFSIVEVCATYTSGVETQKDSLVIQFTSEELNGVRQDIEYVDKQSVEKKYGIKDSRDWTFDKARKDLLIAKDIEILYRPFDPRWTFHTGNTKGIIAYPRAEIMDNLLKDNIALITTKRQTSFDFQHAFVTRLPAERCAISLQTGEVGYVFPLYIYHKDGARVPNLKKEIVDKIENVVGKTTPEDVFDYIYAVLHSPGYREKYKEFLKIDFPRVPYPKDKKQFMALAALGKDLRELHLLESQKVQKYITSYPESGSNTVEKIAYKDAKVYINAGQYFGDVPEVAWNFYIGGYQPAQKWLKDRKGRALTNADIEHYQKIIVALMETDRIMKEIDKTA